ncbi:MAG TPA: universal stress protein [Solirubrobacteraceae bacterium]
MSSSPARDVDALRQRSGIELIAVGVDGGAADCDAALLATAIADAARAELILVAVHPDLPPAVQRRMGTTETKALAAQNIRGFVAPGARTVVESDRSVGHALARVATREQVDLLVVGSSRRAPEGRVQIGRRAHQLLGAAPCALAVAPRGLCSHGKLELRVIGVGYDDTPEAAEALGQAGSLARAAGARLRVRAVVDDRLPYMGVMPGYGPELQEIWGDVVQPDVESLRADAERASLATGAEAVVEVGPGSPIRELVTLSREVDLLAIGSRHWGSPASVLLGGTGEELMHWASCSVMVTPRPPRRSKAVRPGHRAKASR